VKVREAGSHRGEHDSIIETDFFRQIQDKLASQTNGRDRRRINDASLLTGRVP
jgi:hypothetical protein